MNTTPENQVVKVSPGGSFGVSERKRASEGES